MDKGQIKLKPWGLGEENQLIYLIRFFYIFEEFPETHQHEEKKSFNIATFIIEERDLFFLDNSCTSSHWHVCFNQ